MKATIEPTKSKRRHISRRSGAGIRQAVPPRKSKPTYRPAASMLPAVCGAEHPTVEGLVCMSSTVGRNGKPFRHVGAHRATILRGIRLRWDDAEVSA